MNGSIRLLYFFSSSKIRGFIAPIGPRQLGRKRRQGASVLDVVAIFQAQVGLHYRLPRRLGLGLLGGLSKAVGYFLEGLA